MRLPEGIGGVGKSRIDIRIFLHIAQQLEDCCPIQNVSPDRLEQIRLSYKALPAVPVYAQEVRKAVIAELTDNGFPALFQRMHLRLMPAAVMYHGEQVVFQ